MSILKSHGPRNVPVKALCEGAIWHGEPPCRGVVLGSACRGALRARTWEDLGREEMTSIEHDHYSRRSPIGTVVALTQVSLGHTAAFFRPGERIRLQTLGFE